MLIYILQLGKNYSKKVVIQRKTRFVWLGTDECGLSWIEFLELLIDLERKVFKQFGDLIVDRFRVEKLENFKIFVGLVGNLVWINGKLEHSFIKLPKYLLSNSAMILVGRTLALKHFNYLVQYFHIFLYFVLHEVRGRNLEIAQYLIPLLLKPWNKTWHLIIQSA